MVGINLIEAQGNTDLALLAGLLVPAAVAAVLGYIMFYARLKGVYVAIMMLVVTLLLESFLNQTAGPQWFIGKAHLGGNNGLGRFSADIHEPPSLLLGWGESVVEFTHRVAATIVVVLIALPFGAASGRRNIFVGVASSILICFAYFVLLEISLAMGAAGKVPPWLAGWLPNIFFSVAGIWLTARVR